MQKETPSSEIFKPSDAVSFRCDQIKEVGHIASITNRYAIVVTVDGREFKVPRDTLNKYRELASKRVQTRRDKMRALFRIGDRVNINKEHARGLQAGVIVHLNPKTATIDFDDKLYRVAYELLENSRQNDELDNLQRLESIADKAGELLHKHGLSHWGFQFDNARRRGGLCDYRNKMVCMSEQFALRVDDDEVADTLLHEIAHALVGQEHGHDEIWRAMAKKIGCSGIRTHDANFSLPKWIVSCHHCGWHMSRQQRRRNLVCRTCRRAISYHAFTQARADRLGLSYALDERV